jgi:hypothetical protein
MSPEPLIKSSFGDVFSAKAQSVWTFNEFFNVYLLDSVFELPFNLIHLLNYD